MFVFFLIRNELLWLFWCCVIIFLMIFCFMMFVKVVLYVFVLMRSCT